MSYFPYTFFDDFIVRTPTFSYKVFQNLFSERDLSIADLNEIYNNELFKEAIYLASPSLFHQLENWKNLGFPTSLKQHIKLKKTVLKYFDRMSTRCTPFGLFSGVGLGNFDQREDTLLRNINDYTKVRYTKLDMLFLFSFNKYLLSKPVIKNNLLFYPNNSIYRVGNNIRFIEFENKDWKRDYIISSASLSAELEKVISFSKEGKTISDINSILVNNDITVEDGLEYINELIDNQVLVSELQPNVSGIDYSDHIINSLDWIGANSEKAILILIKNILGKIDCKFGNDQLIYSEIEKIFKTLNIEYEEQYLFQTDLYFKEKTLLSYQWKNELRKGISFLNKITCHTNKDTHLEKFKQAFYDRFENQEIALSLALDPEIGVGYRQDMISKDIHPYLNDLSLPNSNENPDLVLKINPVQIILNQKLQKASIKNDYVIKLFDEDFPNFAENWTDLPTTMSFMGEIVSEENQKKLYLNGGSRNAARLFARFNSSKSDIKELVKEISKKERELHPNQILAEILHLPESRTGNILRRPELGNFEIPYLAKSLLPKENQIFVEDLYISIKNDKFLLRSKELNKEIIPLLTNAHNYSTNSLPVYHFLGDLSSQNLRSTLSFNWGDLANIYDFLPRVEYENIILSKAKWKLNLEEINKLQLLSQNIQSFQTEIKKWRLKRKIPQWIQWIKQDHTLLINLENIDLCNMFLSSVKNEDSVFIEEFLSDTEDNFTHQFIFPIYKN